MHDPVRPRHGTSKTKTGCVTCKARRVKCDERHPFCRRCEKAGRTCEGYKAPAPRTHHGQLKIINYVATPTGSLSARPDTDATDRRALSYFQHRTAPELGGSFSSQLWTRFMLLLSHHQVSVKHALIALGSLHESFATSEDLNQDCATDYSLQHYGAAIREVLRIRDDTSKDAAEVALISCVLFACLEGLRGHRQSAISHILSGMKVLEEARNDGDSQHHAFVPQIVLRRLFIRFDSQIENIGGSTESLGISLSKDMPLSIPRCYSSTDEALNELDVLYNRVIHVMYRAEQACKGPVLEPTHYKWLQEEMVRHEVLRQKWHEAFQAMLQSNIAGTGPSSPAVLMLKIYNAVCYILLGVDLIDAESDFARYTSTFHQVVQDSARYLAAVSTKSPSPRLTKSRSATPQPLNPASTTISFSSRTRSPIPPLAPRSQPPNHRTRPTFSLTIGVVAALYFTAARCRSSSIRHRALDLLQNCNRREGLWDSNLAYAIAKGVVDVEEAKLAASNICSELSQKSDAGIPMEYHEIPEEMCVKTVDIAFGPERSGRAKYSFVNSVEAYRRGQVDGEEMGEGGVWKKMMDW